MLIYTNTDAFRNPSRREKGGVKLICIIVLIVMILGVILITPNPLRDILDNIIFALFYK